MKPEYPTKYSKRVLKLAKEQVQHLHDIKCIDCWREALKVYSTDDIENEMVIGEQHND